ncbi:MAG: LysM peptidoglycan-binding domain-containing protein [Acidimicrobiales bacterium]
MEELGGSQELNTPLPIDPKPRRTVAPVAWWCCALLCCGALAAGCGRSDPDQASAVPDDGTEPAVAGIQVVSDEPVVAPAPTPSSVATTATTAAPVSGNYVVQSGDTLSVIAERFGVSVDALSQANQITDVNTIRPGQELIIPG